MQNGGQDVIGFLAEVQGVVHQGKLYEDIHQLTPLVADVSTNFAKPILTTQRAFTGHGKEMGANFGG